MVLNQGPSAYQPDALPPCQTSSCIIKGELNYLFEARNCHGPCGQEILGFRIGSEIKSRHATVFHSVSGSVSNVC